MKDEKIMVIGDSETGKSLLVKDLKRKGYINVVEKENLSSIEDIRDFDKLYLFRNTDEKTLSILGFKKLGLPDDQFIKQDYTKSYDIYNSIKNYYIKLISERRMIYKVYKL